MAYTVFEKVWDLTGKATSGAYGRETRDDAIALFHKKMGTDMNPKVYSAALVVVLGDDGASYKNEKWDAPVAPGEPAVEPEGE